MPEGTPAARRAGGRSGSKKRPSDVFRARLRETRKRRDNMSQAELGRRMREAGYPLDKAAVLRIEKGERGISLDEALAFASVLAAVPAQMLTPPGDEYVYLTKNVGVNGSGMRAWLRFGDSFIAHSGDIPDELFVARAQQAILIYAKGLVDANLNRDKAGAEEAFRAMQATFDEERKRQEQKDLEERERRAERDEA
jgi:hypothetical protein